MIRLEICLIIVSYLYFLFIVFFLCVYLHASILPATLLMRCSRISTQYRARLFFSSKYDSIIKQENDRATTAKCVYSFAMQFITIYHSDTSCLMRPSTKKTDCPQIISKVKILVLFSAEPSSKVHLYSLFLFTLDHYNTLESKYLCILFTFPLLFSHFLLMDS